MKAAMIAASSLALAATGCAAVEGVTGAPGLRSHRPLRLSTQQLVEPATVSAGMGEMQRWHLEAATSRQACTQHEEGGHVQRLRGGSDMMMKSKPAFVTKMQNSLSSSRAAIMWVIKGLLAAFTGLLTTSAVMVAFEFTAHKVRPATGTRPVCLQICGPYSFDDAPFCTMWHSLTGGRLFVFGWWEQT